MPTQAEPTEDKPLLLVQTFTILDLNWFKRKGEHKSHRFLSARLTLPAPSYQIWLGWNDRAGGGGWEVYREGQLSYFFNSMIYSNNVSSFTHFC